MLLIWEWPKLTNSEKSESDYVHDYKNELNKQIQKKVKVTMLPIMKMT